MNWRLLLTRIKRGRCTPFLGAGICDGTLPPGTKIASRWAKEEEYPLEDRSDLSRVAQYLAIENDAMYPKDKILEELFEDNPCPDFDEKDEPHRVLASFDLPVYITTNYDDFMLQALQRAGKTPHREICRWHELLLEDIPSELAEGYEPTPEEPVVFYLHGHKDKPESLVLTEDDYVDFLVNLTTDFEGIIPPRIRNAMAAASLLFIGYSLRDWSFRVISRAILQRLPPSQKYKRVTVQLPPEVPQKKRAQQYLEKYMQGTMQTEVHWATAREFAAELRQRWEEFTNGRANRKQ